MKFQTKIYIAAGVALIFAIALVAYAWSNHKIQKLETAVEHAKTEALKKQQTAAAKESEAAAYKQKIEYLESKLAEIKHLSRKQDEQLEKLSINSRNARGDVERARSTRAITATAAELCAKLTEIGHPCE